MKRKIINKIEIKYHLIAVLVSVFILTINYGCFAQSREYTILTRPDGGYKIDITYNKRHWKPITAEGIFPKEIKKYTIEIIGKGKDWSFRNQEGFYYSAEEVQSKKKAWDFGYAWIDSERRFLYLNFYWVSAPKNVTPSDVNGKYKINKEK